MIERSCLTQRDVGVELAQAQHLSVNLYRVGRWADDVFVINRERKWLRDSEIPKAMIPLLKDILLTVFHDENVAQENNEEVGVGRCGIVEPSTDYCEVARPVAYVSEKLTGAPPARGAPIATPSLRSPGELPTLCGWESSLLLSFLRYQSSHIVTIIKVSHTSQVKGHRWFGFSTLKLVLAFLFLAPPMTERSGNRYVKSLWVDIRRDFVLGITRSLKGPGSTMARRVDHSFVDTVDTRVRDTERRTMAAVEVVNLRVNYQEDVCRRESLEFYSRHQEAQEDRATVRAEIEILRRERLAYEQESIETRQALARSEAYSRALEARIRVLESQAYRHEWKRQDADDRAIEHIMRTQALEAGARVDTLEDTASRLIMTTVNQGMSVEEIEQIVAQRVANAIEAIAIYESINQTKQQENKVAGNASNKRKWEGIGRRSMLELYLCVTSASFTTLACVRKGVTIASGGATKQEIVGSQA
ncbi:hypothetical protein Tco_0141029 [Tanacetum coccineum]